MDKAGGLDWNDLRYFLAVARSGTTLAASRLLGTSQSTVARRIAAMEAALGLALFLKGPSGYDLTPDGEELRNEAETAEAAMNAFEARAAAHRRSLSGTVRLTTNEMFASMSLLEIASDFRKTFPEMRLQVITSDGRLDLAGGEADIALRAGGRPSEPGLVGRRLLKDPWSLYCSRSYAASFGVPSSESELAGHRIVIIDPLKLSNHYGPWIKAHIPDEAVVMWQSSVPGLYAAIKSGLGISLMSDFVAGTDPELVRAFTPQVPSPPEIWLVTHERLRHVPRIRATLDFIAGHFQHRQTAQGRKKAS